MPSAQDVEGLDVGRMVHDAMDALMTAEKQVHMAKEKLERIMKAHLQSSVRSPEAPQDIRPPSTPNMLPQTLSQQPEPEEKTKRPSSQKETNMQDQGMHCIAPVSEHVAEPNKIRFANLFRKGGSNITHMVDLLAEDKVDEILTRSEHFKRLYKYKTQDTETSVQKLVGSNYFDAFSMLNIVLNSAMVGWKTVKNVEDVRRMAAEGNIHSIFYVHDFVLDSILLLAFVIEVVFRARAVGIREFFTGEACQWNIFDTFLLLANSVEMVTNVVLQAMSPDTKPLFSFLVALRVVRVLRIARSVRVIRTWPFFKDLRLMVASLASCMKTLLWVASVMSVMFYGFGIAFTEAALSHLSTVEEWENEANEDLKDMFGSLHMSTISLFKAMSGGDDWSCFYNALGQAGGIWQVLFLMYISINFFAVVNVVTGIFVQSALDMAMDDKEALLFQREETHRDTARRVCEVFAAMGKSRDDAISLAELKEFMKCKHSAALVLEDLGLMSAELERFFEIYDRNSDGRFTLDEFLEGILTLQGGGNFFHQAIMRQDLTIVRKHLMKLLEKYCAQEECCSEGRFAMYDQDQVFTI